VAAARLAAAGVDTPDLDARLLIGQVLGLDATAFITAGDRRLSTDDQAQIDPVIDRRCAREPVSRILGRREFWSLSFTLGPETLDPRPDSETLVEAGLAALAERDHPWRVLDLGTGSGCLLLSVLSERPLASGIGVDLSASALSTASANAVALGLSGRCRFVRADWCAGIAHPLGPAPFDLVLSNPPYIPTPDLGALELEVTRFDPHAALDGGEDGLSAYRALAPQLPDLLGSSGVAVIEIGQGQATDVCRLFGEAGLVIETIRRDLAGIERCLVVRRGQTDTR